MLLNNSDEDVKKNIGHEIASYHEELDKNVKFDSSRDL